MRLTGKRRIAVATAGAVAAIGMTAAVSPSAFGIEGSVPETAKTLSGPETAKAPTSAGPAAAGRAGDPSGHADSGVSATDGTVFHNGVMSLGAPPAHTRAAVAGPPQGEGWKLANGVTKSLATGYTIKFYDQQSVNWLGRYVKASAADLKRVTNLPVSVNTTPVGWNYNRPRGEIVIGVLKRPCVPPADNGQTGWKVVRDGSGTANLSCGFISSSIPSTVTSGHAYIDSSFFTKDGKPSPSWGETFLRNHISHELGHTMGLTHADRSAKRGDCVTGKDSGQKPVMCTETNSGYHDKRAGTYVQQFDVQGLRHLAAGAGVAVPPQGKVTGLGGKCLDVKGGKPANGTQIQLYTCNGSAGQSWIRAKDGTFRALGKCLDNARNAATDGNRISLFDCNGGAAQRWSVNAKGQIVHVASGKVLDVTGGSTANGTKIQLHTANTYKRQLWNVPK
ncbi:ricin-type beta-trefoil lectin domain protein [Streptomyces sp. I05A-00742]|uniref:ricin-type beta-trefoil lectin domain protein n=1 Tax=Streptomyces sp. I05A-00742 TaxID=2732853 RepID=UPI0014891829|nr:ricin-type beta-trefoil lectin domain protein [Streptomyces sp. I05A-00742]